MEQGHVGWDFWNVIITNSGLYLKIWKFNKPGWNKDYSNYLASLENWKSLFWCDWDGTVPLIVSKENNK